MKTTILLLLVLAVPLVLSAQTQDTTGQSTSGSTSTQSNSSQGQATGNQQTSGGNNQQMSGTVSSNGKTFTSDSNNQNYKVDNPSALQSVEGQHVAVLVHVDPDTGTVHIIQVATPPQQ